MVMQQVHFRVSQVNSGHIVRFPQFFQLIERRSQLFKRMLPLSFAFLRLQILTQQLTVQVSLPPKNDTYMS